MTRLRPLNILGVLLVHILAVGCDRDRSVADGSTEDRPGHGRRVTLHVWNETVWLSPAASKRILAIVDTPTRTIYGSEFVPAMPYAFFEARGRSFALYEGGTLVEKVGENGSRSWHDELLERLIVARDSARRGKPDDELIAMLAVLEHGATTRPTTRP